MASSWPGGAIEQHKDWLIFAAARESLDRKSNKNKNNRWEKNSKKYSRYNW